MIVQGKRQSVNRYIYGINPQWLEWRGIRQELIASGLEVLSRPFSWFVHGLCGEEYGWKFDKSLDLLSQVINAQLDNIMDIHFQEGLNERDKYKEKKEFVEGTSGDSLFYTDKYGYKQYEYTGDANYTEWYEKNVIDLGKGHIVSDATMKIRTSLTINPDGFIEIEVKKHYFENTNITVYESGDGYFHLNPLSAYVGKKVSFCETGEDEERFTLDDMQALNSEHNWDKWYDYGKVTLNLGSDIFTVSTFGTGAAASASAKGVGIAFVKAVLPTTAKEGVEFALIQGGQMAGDYYFYDSKPTDDLYKAAKSMLPGVGTYYALVDATSKNTVIGLYSPIE